MTNELDKPTQDAVLKAVIKLMGKIDQDKDKNILQEHTKALNALQSCLQEIKVKLNVVQSEQAAFHEARRDRSENCDKIHNDFEQRLRNVPTAERCRVSEKRVEDIEIQVGEVSEKRVEKIELTIGQITPFMYKVAGATIVLAVIATPIIGALVAYIAKKLGG